MFTDGLILQGLKYPAILPKPLGIWSSTTRLDQTLPSATSLLLRPKIINVTTSPVLWLHHPWRSPEVFGDLATPGQLVRKGVGMDRSCRHWPDIWIVVCCLGVYGVCNREGKSDDTNFWAKTIVRQDYCQSLIPTPHRGLNAGEQFSCKMTLG